MTLAEILRRINLARPTYDALVRRGALPFMQRLPVDPVSGYGDVHLLALAAHAAFRELGLAPQLAGEAVNSGISLIQKVATGHVSKTIGRQIGVRMVATKHGHIVWDYVGSGRPREGSEIGRVILNLCALKKQFLTAPGASTLSGAA